MIEADKRDMWSGLSKDSPRLFQILTWQIPRLTSQILIIVTQSSRCFWWLEKEQKFDNSLWLNLTLKTVILTWLNVRSKTVFSSWLIVTLKTTILTWLYVRSKTKTKRVFSSWLIFTLKTVILVQLSVRSKTVFSSWLIVTLQTLILTRLEVTLKTAILWRFQRDDWTYLLLFTQVLIWALSWNLTATLYFMDVKLSLNKLYESLLTSYCVAFCPFWPLVLNPFPLHSVWA